MKLKHDKLLSRFAFNCKLRQYSTAAEMANQFQENGTGTSCTLSITAGPLIPLDSLIFFAVYFKLNFSSSSTRPSLSYEVV